MHLYHLATLGDELSIYKSRQRKTKYNFGDRKFSLKSNNFPMKDATEKKIIFQMIFFVEP